MWKFKNLKIQEFVPLIYFFVEMYEPDVYVEVGVEAGYTFNQISLFVKEAYAVDIKPMGGIIRADHVHTCQMSSEHFANKWKKGDFGKDKKIDLLFIDADHRRNSVLLDFDLLSKFVTPGTGLVLLHDTYPSDEHLLRDGWCSNAWEAAEEIHTNKNRYGDWEIVTLPGPYAGLSILRNVSQGHLHWMRKD
jgi:hypothetical protein